LKGDSRDPPATASMPNAGHRNGAAGRRLGACLRSARTIRRVALIRIDSLRTGWRASARVGPHLTVRCGDSTDGADTAVAGSRSHLGPGRQRSTLVEVVIGREVMKHCGVCGRTLVSVQSVGGRTICPRCGSHHLDTPAPSAPPDTRPRPRRRPGRPTEAAPRQDQR